MLDRPKRGPVEGSGVGEVCHFRGCRRCPAHDSASGKNCTPAAWPGASSLVVNCGCERVAAAEQSTDQHRSQPVVLLRAVASTREAPSTVPEAIVDCIAGQAE